MMEKIKFNELSALFMIVAVNSGWVNAQGEARSNRMLEEVKVTAQKREEDSQDVPISISAFGGEKLAAMGIGTTADLPKITPGLTFTQQFGFTVIYLRGVGSDAYLPSADPSIATYIDGINVPATQGKQDSLGAVERVEVLKGPQGTLFGRNSTGGAINIVTKAPPTESAEGYVDLGFGNYNTRSYQAYFGMPVTDTLGFTVAASSDDSDGYGDNYFQGEKSDFREDFSEGLRLKLLWDVSDQITVTMAGSYTNQYNGKGLRLENVRPSPVFGAGAPRRDADRDTNTNYEGGNGTIHTLGSLEVEWRPGPLDIKFLYSDQLADVDFAQLDFDGTEDDRSSFFTYDQYTDQKTFELQLLSNEDSWLSDNLEWVAGLYRLEGEAGFGSVFFTVGSGFAAALLAPDAQVPSLLQSSVENLLSTTDVSKVVLESGGLLITESNSAYFQGTWIFNEEWNVTLGARFQQENREITNSFLDLVAPTATGTEDQAYYEEKDRSKRNRNTNIAVYSAPDIDEETFSPKFVIQWFPSSDVQVYASAQKAYKSSTFNIINFFEAPDKVDAEEVIALELGAKAEFFDGSLRLNTAVFHTVTDNVVTASVSFTSGGIVQFQNAGESEAQGAELDFQWQPFSNWNPGLVVSGSASYIDAIYTDYPNGSGFDDDTGLYFGEDTITGEDTSRDFTGNRVVRTPRFSSNLSFSQYLDFNGLGALEFSLDYAFRGDSNTTPQSSPLYIQPQYELWGGRVSWFYDPAGIQVTAFVSNAKDEEYYSTLQQQDFGKNVGLAPPRLYGLKLKWNYDS